MCAISRVVVVLPFVPVISKDRDARRCSGRKQHIDHVLGDIAPDAFARRKVHPKSGCRVDLDNSAAAFLQRFANVRGDDIDAGNIQPDDPGDTLEQKDVLRMDFIRAVDGGSAGRDIGSCFQMKYLAFGQNGIKLIALFLDADAWSARRRSIWVSTFSCP